MKIRLDSNGIWMDEYICLGVSDQGHVIKSEHYVTDCGEMHLLHHFQAGLVDWFLPAKSMCPGCMGIYRNNRLSMEYERRRAF